eukprot:7659855-Alexandrium_andersonii.AAC.1
MEPSPRVVPSVWVGSPVVHRRFGPRRCGACTCGTPVGEGAYRLVQSAVALSVGVGGVTRGTPLVWSPPV